MTSTLDPEGEGPGGSSPVVVELRPLGREASKVRLRLSDESQFTIALETVLDLGLRTDDPVDERLRAALVDHDLHFRAREAALGLLALRPRSRRELTDRLRRKEIPGRVITRVLDRLVETGLLDDADFARALIRDRLRLRPRGRRALSAELARKGVDRTVVDRVLDEVFEEMETDEGEVADRVAEAWVRRQPRKILDALGEGPFTDDGGKAWRRGLGHLARKGFGGGTARAALERALAARE